MVSSDEFSNLYDVLGLHEGASEKEIRRAYRNLATREHPDKGGDEEKFKHIQRAYEILSDASKRDTYNATGRVDKTADEEFLDGFGGGSFRDKYRDQELQKESMAEQLTVRSQPQSHSAGFEAWVRARGGPESMMYTEDDLIAEQGVMKESYQSVPLPTISAHQVVCTKLGRATEGLEVESKPLPAALEWGEVLVSVRAAPINVGDITTTTFGVVGSARETVDVPFVAGHDGVGVVMKVGPGVKGLQENDWVLPLEAGLGMWRSLAVVKEKQVLKVPGDCMPVEYLSVAREMCAAYRLLEDFGSVKPGDAVIVNGATSTVGQVLIQLGTILRMRMIAVARSHEETKKGSWAKTSNWLKSLGAAQVLEEGLDLRSQLEKIKFFAKPKLALDCVGSYSAVRLGDALAPGSPLVVYGCMTGKAPIWPWHAWVLNELKVSGFNLRRWTKENKKKVPGMLEALGKLIKADKLVINFTEYELSTEFDEALEHALEPGRCTKVVLKMTDVGITY